ncbi:hypothetical protein ACN28G_14340 [Micromonospora sp. WMMA1923]|uniref:hypothetical protein n=1 Tax=Micromonospora sp. WMMA1923 TaxID=3404125 RepID=UPI003B94A9E2
MTTSGFQEALARLLVEPELRARWRSDPRLLSGELDLDADDRRMLSAIDPDRLDFTAGGIERARARTLKRMFPATLRVAGGPEAADRLVIGYLRSVVPLVARDEVTKWIDEGERFVGYLAELAARGEVPTAVADLAWLEWLRAELRYSPEAARGAAWVQAHHPGGTPPQAGTLLRLAPHVRVARFEADVLALAGGRPPAASGPTCLALAGRPDGAVRTFRLTVQAHDLYLACDGSRTLSGLTATAGPEAADLLAAGWVGGLLIDAAVLSR